MAKSCIFQDVPKKYAAFFALFSVIFLVVIRLTVNLAQSTGGLCEPFYSEKLTNGRKKLILYATTFFAEESLHVSYLNDHLNGGCPDLKCLGLTSRYREACFDKADAIIFSPVYEDFYQAIAMFSRRKRRNRRQLWIFKSLESPLKLVQLLPRGEAFYTWADGLFNVSLTYRLDSDIPVPYRKRFIRIQKANSTPFRHEIFAKKKRHIAAVISGCHDVWHRIDRLKELTSFGVTLDIYGKCGNLTCPGRVSDECFHKLEPDYFFYAAIENTICRDYVTEKFFFPLRYNMVPLVAGGGNYSLLGPPHSYIDWHDFSSPQQLAEFLLKLSGNGTAYASYFAWKGLYQFPDGPPYQFACSLCELLNKQMTSTSYKVLKNLKTWWLDHSGCVMDPYEKPLD